MHFTAGAQPQVIDAAGDLPDDVFRLCKEKMRPVKKLLQQLNEITDWEKKGYKKCLLGIGDQISQCLKEYKSENEHKLWRNNLWTFVSKFTDYEPRKLYKKYKSLKGGEHQKSGNHSKDHSSHRSHPSHFVDGYHRKNMLSPGAPLPLNQKRPAPGPIDSMAHIKRPRESGYGPTTSSISSNSYPGSLQTSPTPHNVSHHWSHQSHRPSPSHPNFSYNQRLDRYSSDRPERERERDRDRSIDRHSSIPYPPYRRESGSGSRDSGSEWSRGYWPNSSRPNYNSSHSSHPPHVQMSGGGGGFSSQNTPGRRPPPPPYPPKPSPPNYEHKNV